MRHAHAVRCVLVAGILAGLAAAPAPAHAQFKLPKVKLPGSSKSESAPVPTFNARVLEINDQHLAAFHADLKEEGDSLAAARARYAVARRLYEDSVKAYPKMESDYKAKKKTWDGCVDENVKPAEQKAQRESEQAQENITGGDEAAFQAAMQKVAGRIQAAAQAGNMAEVQRLTDSVGKASQQATAGTMKANEELQAAGALCGHEPEAPRRPIQPTLDRPRTTRAATRKLGLTDEQQAIMWDRIQPLLWSKQKSKKDFDEAVKKGGFSPSEQAALNNTGFQLYEQYSKNQQLGSES